MATNYIQTINGVKIYAERAAYTTNGINIDSKFSEIEQEITSMGAFEVVNLTSGADPVPDVANPKTDVIYLTKDSSSSAKDPYTEWIYIPASTEPAVAAHWEIIGETSIDLSGYKTKQTAVSVTGGTLKGVASFEQNANGVVTLTLNDIQDGTTSQKGVVLLEDSYTSTSTTTAATPNAVKAAYDLADGKQDPITFDGEYNATSNKAATQSTVSNAIAALDATATSTDGTNVQVQVTQADGVITAVNITDNTAASNHVHGNITNDGKIGSTADLAVVTTTGGEVTTADMTTASPVASGNGLEFIDTVTQDSKGKISATKKTVQDASTSQKGVVQLQGAIGATETSDATAATPKAVRDAIDALDATVASAGDTGVTPNFGLSVTEADGKITGVTVTSDNTENKNNKVTSWTSTTTNTNYPSEKLVKDSLDGKANLCVPAATGNLATLSATGDLVDSTKSVSDFATAAQGAKADSAVQGVTVNGTPVVDTDTKVAAIPAASTDGVYGVVTYTTIELSDITNS